MTMCNVQPITQTELFEALLEEEGIEYQKETDAYEATEYTIHTSALYVELTVYNTAVLEVEYTESLNRGSFSAGKELHKLFSLLKKLQSAGLQEIWATAGKGGSSQMVGYKVWYKMGFISNFGKKGTDQMLEAFGVATVEELCSTVEGRKLWNEKGFEYPIKYVL